MTSDVTNLVVSWVAVVNLPLLLLIIRMLWGFERRLTALETINLMKRTTEK